MSRRQSPPVILLLHPWPPPPDSIPIESNLHRLGNPPCESAFTRLGISSAIYPSREGGCPIHLGRRNIREGDGTRLMDRRPHGHVEHGDCQKRPFLRPRVSARCRNPDRASSP